MGPAAPLVALLERAELVDSRPCLPPLALPIEEQVVLLVLAVALTEQIEPLALLVALLERAELVDSRPCLPPLALPIEEQVVLLIPVVTLLIPVVAGTRLVLVRQRTR
jgi:hypothetical protein